METVAKLFRNFWVCLGFAVFSLFALWGAVYEGEGVWIAVDAFCVVYWVSRAYRTTKPLPTEVVLTKKQTHRITVITRQFKRDLDEIIKEADDNESNRRKDQEEDKGESSDE